MESSSGSGMHRNSLPENSIPRLALRMEQYAHAQSALLKDGNENCNASTEGILEGMEGCPEALNYCQESTFVSNTHC